MDTATVLSLIGLLVAIAGLAVALYQLDRTSTAVEAAEKAAVRTEREAALRSLLSLLPTLEQSEFALDAAVSANEFAVARRELASWRARAADVKGLLSGRVDVQEEIRVNLDASITQAATAKSRLFDEKVDIVAATDRARREIAICVQELTEMAGRLKAYAESEVADE